MLYEAMRNYFAINTSGNVSILYKYLSCFVQPMQGPFDAYAAFRATQALIASCKWQIGQLTNVLNYLFDNVLNRIFITQNTVAVISDPIFNYAPIHFDSDFGTAPPQQFERIFTDKSNQELVKINVPAAVDLNEITAVIEQIRVSGIPYQIVQI